VIVRLPDFEPLLVGENSTAMVQVPFAARELVFVHVPPVPNPKLPLMLILESVSVVVPTFFSVTSFDPLVVPDF
jgi:hypothetical protein